MGINWLLTAYLYSTSANYCFARTNFSILCLIFPLDLKRLLEMKFAAIIASILVTASAFAPVSRIARSSSMKMADFSKEIGAQVPLATGIL